jgi:4'-phosphopantetheinyl transferase
MSLPPLGVDEVALYCAAPGPLADCARSRGWTADLLAGERARLARMAAAPGARFLAGRVLLRAALLEGLGPHAAGVRLRAPDGGRPELEGAASDGASASLAHTHGLVVCALARGATVGVDVEWLGRRLAPQPLADRFFAPDEAERLRRTAASTRSAAFLRLWTAKEAYLKARGLGIAGHLSRVAVVEDGEPPALRLDPSLADDASAWQLAWCTPTREHVAAWVVRHGCQPPRRPRLRPLDPASVASLIERIP